jgi:hypothetical protein
MKPETKTELDALISRVEKHRAALKLTPAKFVARYQRYLGSVRSYEDRILPRNFERLNTDRLVVKLKQFVGELDGGSSAETVIQDLPVLVKLWTLFEVLQGQTNDRRCLLFLGSTGVGKTVSGRAICNDAQTASKTAFVKCLPRWERSPMALVSGVCRATGCAEPDNYYEALDSLIAALRSDPKTVFFDDAHYGGVPLLALIKVLIDETPGRFIYMSFPSDFTMLITSSLRASAEAAQLFGRTLKPKFDDYREGVRERDVALYLRRAAGLDGDAQRTARQITALIRNHGNLRLLVDAVESARIVAEDQGGEMTGEDIAAEVRALCGLKETAAAETQEAA